VIDAARWPDADALLDQALALPAEARTAFVAARAGHDAALLAALLAVLREADDTGAFLRPGTAVASAVAAALDDTPGGADEPPDLLAPGAVVEHYEIVGLIGRGGMGEVYRARDRRLGRDVALKVLPERFATDPDRLARFRREARVLASLSHPGIGAIYGLAEADGVEALVLEYVAGPTLAERIGGSPLPLPELLPLARGIVDALDAAHTRGVLHRDLKPANIKVAGDGTVTILDFGLAKALDVTDAANGTTDLTAQTPHVLLGTASYMSPEQIRRERLDQRTDIWAFGCIVFEMLTGTRAFPGATTHDVLARVLEREPAYSLLPPDTPPALRRLLRRTLEKDARRRLGYIGDARHELDDAVNNPPADPDPAAAGSRRPWVAAAIAGVAIGALITGGPWWRARSETPAAAVARFALPLGAASPVLSYQPMLAMAPDGQAIAYRARHDGTTRVYLRRLAGLDAVPVPGTEGATGLFFSPDGQWLGFDSDGVVKRVALAGGPPVVIGPAPGGVTATWTADDVLVFATNTGRTLQRMPIGGGTAMPLTSLDAARGDTLHLLPQALPGGRAVLFTIAAGRSRHIATADLESGRIQLVTDGTHGRFVAPETLVYVRDGTLFGQRFDVATGTVSGAAVPLVDGLEHTDNTVVHYDAAASGSLAYLPAGQVPAPARRLVWFDRTGRQTLVPVAARPFARLSLSPDGAQAAVSIEEAGNTDVWVVDLRRGTTLRLTTAPTIDAAPVWSPDGRWIAFRSEREGPGLFRRDAVAAGPIEQLTTTDGPIHSPSAWSPDSRTLLFALFRSYRHQAVASVTPPDRTIRVLLDGDFAQSEPHLSPDGRWLAYQSDESGRLEVYVRPYPAVTSGRWQVSAQGGSSPRWSPDGRELLFLDGAGLAAMPVRTAGGFTVTTPRRLFGVAPFGTRLGSDYDVSPDGRQFLFVVDEPSPETAPAHLVVVQHWDGEVRRRLAEGR
jgi:serine/threonine protein kinase